MFFRVGRWGVWVAIAGEVTWDTWDVAGVLQYTYIYIYVIDDSYMIFHMIFISVRFLSGEFLLGM